MSSAQHTFVCAVLQNLTSELCAAAHPPACLAATFCRTGNQAPCLQDDDEGIGTVKVLRIEAPAVELSEVRTNGTAFVEGEWGDDRLAHRYEPAGYSSIGPAAAAQEICADTVICELSYLPQYSQGAELT